MPAKKIPNRPFIRTLQQARDFVEAVHVCTIFSGKAKGVPALWDYVDLPDWSGREDGSGWGQRVTAVWTWKNELPAKYPKRIFYGKIPGGHAALIAMNYLRKTHYPAHHKPVRECSPLARIVYEFVRTEAPVTADLRRLVMESADVTKSQFDRAHKELQITLNIVRLNLPSSELDTWVRFEELYPEFAAPTH